MKVSNSLLHAVMHTEENLRNYAQTYITSQQLPNSLSKLIECNMNFNYRVSEETKKNINNNGNNAKANNISTTQKKNQEEHSFHISKIQSTSCTKNDRFYAICYKMQI